MWERRFLVGFPIVERHYETLSLTQTLPTAKCPTFYSLNSPSHFTRLAGVFFLGFLGGGLGLRLDYHVCSLLVCF